MSGRTYHAALQEAERLRGELVEEHRAEADATDWSRWADDPVGWDLEAGRDPVDYQRDVMGSVAENIFTTWRGCNGCGKEWTAGSLAVWAAYARGMLVLVVSATERQVIGQTMREVRRAWRAGRRAHGIGGKVFQGSVRIGDEDRIVALTGSANVDALQGWHDPKNGVLIIISEGQGERLEDVAYDAAMGNRTTDKGRILAMGNPVRPVGRFYEIHRRAHWKRFRTSAFDTPNVKVGEVVRPGFPAPNWPDQIAAEYGEASPFYIGRVEAEFPDQAEDALLSRNHVDGAFDRFESGTLESEAEGKPYVLGLDPAALGKDASALVVWQGPVAREYHKWRGLEATELAEEVVGVVERLLEDGVGVSRVYVDEIGVGHGVKSILADRLKGLEYWSVTRWSARRLGVRTAGVNVSRKPKDTDRFVRRKDELTWALRDRLVDGEVALRPSEELAEELLAVDARQTADGKIEIVGKNTLRGRLGRSPDLLDALLLGTSDRVGVRHLLSRTPASRRKRRARRHRARGGRGRGGGVADSVHKATSRQQGRIKKK